MCAKCVQNIQFNLQYEVINTWMLICVDELYDQDMCSNTGTIFLKGIK